jgi:hypothetical protein
VKKSSAIVGKAESPREYDDPLTPEEAAESDSAWEDYVAGRDRGEPLQKVREDLLKNHCD